MMSWDGKVTSFLAAIGGCKDLIRTYLQKTGGLYQDFVSRVHNEWTMAFPTISQGLSSISPPKKKIPLK